MSARHPVKMTVHGAAVALQGGALPPAAVLLRGPSGSGKSDLAFRLIGLGAELIGDDQVLLERRQDRVMASAPEAIRGLLEVRGLGLVKYPAGMAAPLRVVVDLVAREEVPRMPEAADVEILGLRLPGFRLHAFDASAPLKVLKAIELAQRPDLLV